MWHPRLLPWTSSRLKADSWSKRVPCLTRARAVSGGYWITNANGLLTTREMLRLQGLPECLATIAETAGVSERQLCQMIGNAMPVNVLVATSSRLLPALGLP